jgi:anti-sigma factor RsiW
MQCDQNPTTLASYLDGELSPEQAATIHTHIATCPQCAVKIAELARLHRSLLPARNRFTPTAEFRQKIQSQLAQSKPRPKRFNFIPIALALAAMLLLTFGWMQYSRRANAFAEVADLHVNALASANPLDVVSTDRHTVKPWFQGRIPFSFNVPELAGTDFTLLGGRLVYLHQQPGAQLIFAMKQHKISVLIFQDSIFQASSTLSPLLVDSKTLNRNSFNIETWRSHDLRFFIIGDADPTGIEKLVQYLKQANQ